MNSPDIPPYINVSKMANLLNLSRSRLYQLIDQGILLKPVNLLSNKRPVYTRNMALRNLQVKQENVGINGEILMFYSTRIPIPAPKPKMKKFYSQEPAPKNSKDTELLDALESLGLENVTTSQVHSAISKCFPDGTENVDEDEIIAEVFRYLNRQNPEHKQ